MTEVAGTIYLIHFVPSFRHAKHYLGWTKGQNPEPRIEHHRAGSGSRLCRAAARHGCELLHVLSFPGTRNLERRLKNRKDVPCWCPQCTGRSADEVVAWLARTYSDVW